MVNPIFEKITIVVSILLGLLGLYIMVSHFFVAGVGFVIASIAGVIGIFALVFFFTRHPA